LIGTKYILLLCSFSYTPGLPFYSWHGHIITQKGYVWAQKIRLPHTTFH